jgi:predicted nucleic acid-binding protein
MTGKETFIDTNICIYLLNGDNNVADLLQNQIIYISVITEIELYSFHHTDEAKKVLDSFIEAINVINITQTIKESTINLRKVCKLKIPDSIVAASALVYSFPLITSDKAFSKVPGLDLFLYQQAVE